jgi:hypothetical protein
VGWVVCQKSYFLGSSSLTRKGLVSLASIGILVSVYWWYFMWVPYLTEEYNFGGHFFMGLSFNQGFQDLVGNWQFTMKRFYDTPFKYSGFVIFLIGLYIVVRKKLWLQLSIFLIPFLAYWVVVLKSGYGFHLNPYYVIMFIPPMAFLGGWGLAQVNKKYVATLLLLIVAIEGIANQSHVLQIRQPYLSLTELEDVLDSVSKRGDLIVINGTAGADPTPMYFAHRKGWVFTTPDLIKSENLCLVKNNGGKYAVMVKKLYGEASLSFPVVYDSEYFRIYKIQ